MRHWLEISKSMLSHHVPIVHMVLIVVLWYHILGERCHISHHVLTDCVSNITISIYTLR